MRALMTGTVLYIGPYLPVQSSFIPLSTVPPIKLITERVVLSQGSGHQQLLLLHDMRKGGILSDMCSR